MIGNRVEEDLRSSSNRSWHLSPMPSKWYYLIAFGDLRFVEVLSLRTSNRGPIPISTTNSGSSSKQSHAQTNLLLLCSLKPFFLSRKRLCSDQKSKRDLETAWPGSIQLLFEFWSCVFGSEKQAEKGERRGRRRRKPYLIRSRRAWTLKRGPD